MGKRDQVFSGKRRGSAPLCSCQARKGIIRKDAGVLAIFAVAVIIFLAERALGGSRPRLTGIPRLR
jgi:hypothetical protein